MANAKVMVKAKSLMLAAGVVSALCSFAPRDAAAQSRRTTAATKTPAAVDSSVIVARLIAADEQRAFAALTSLRATYLRKADWADLGDRCNPGALRVFPNDTTPRGRDSVQALAEDMERIVVGRGAGSALNAAEARALLRVVVGWEAGIDRPNWDVAGTAKPRPAFAAGLTGEVPDPTGPGCLPSPAMGDTVTFVVPGFADMEFPRAPRPRVKAYFGPQAQLHARDEFFAEVGSKDPRAELKYVLIAPMVIWKGYAMVGVRRPQELGGVQVDGSNRGSAAYLFRKVGAEWRVLSVVR